MKDIYELLNEVEMDLDEFEEISLDELYRKKVKKNVRGHIRAIQSPFAKGSKIAIVLLCIILSSTFISFKINPTFATSLPVVGRFIKDISGYGNDLFDQYTSVINKSDEKSGIKMTLNEVMLDRNQLRIAITLYSKNATDKNLYPNSPTVFFNGNVLKSHGSSGTGEYIDANTLVSVSTLDVHGIKMPSNINMKIMYDHFSYLDENGESQVIKGPWVFEFAVSKDAIESKTETYKIKREITYDNTTMYLQDITITPLTTHMKYKFRGKRPLKFLIKDEKGTALREEMSGYGSGNLFDILFKKTRGEVDFSAVSQDAHTLTVIPYSENMRMGERIRTEPLKYEGKLPFVLKSDDKNKLTIYSVERRDGKVYVGFKTEGILYDIFKYRLYLYNDQTEELNRSIELNDVYGDINEEGLLTLVFEDDPETILYFSTDAMSDINVIEGAEFTININGDK